MSNPFLNKTTSTVDNNLLHRIIRSSSSSPTTFSLPNLNNNAQPPQSFQPYARNLPSQSNSNISTQNSTNSKIPRTDSITITQSPSRSANISQTRSPNRPRNSNRISNTPPRSPRSISDHPPRIFPPVDSIANNISEGQNSKVVTISIKTSNGAIEIKTNDKQMFSPNQHRIGQLRIPSGIRTQKSYLSYAKKYHSQLNLAIYINCQEIRQAMQNKNFKDFPVDIEKRLQKGFDFYQNSKEVTSAMKTILDQNQMMGININLCQAIKKMTQDLRISPLLCYYSIFHFNKGIRNLSKQQCDSFIMNDRINLVKIYIQLNKNGRLSARNYVKKKDELKVIDGILKYYSKGPFGERDQWTNLGLSIIQLLSTILIKNSSEICPKQVKDYFSHFVEQLKKDIIQQSPEESAMNELLFSMFLKWPNEMRNVNFKKIKSFIDYYLGQITSISEIARIMKQLNEIKQYDEPMKNLVRQKTNFFLNSQANQKFCCIRTAIEAILLIKQSIKSGYLDTVQILIRILFNQSPSAALQLVFNFLTNHDLILPYLANSIKNSSDRFASIQNINQYLIPQFKFKSSSQSFIRLKYIINLLQTYCKADYPNYHIANWQLLDETLYKVKKFSFRFTDVSNEISEMKIIELIERYIISFTNEFQPQRGSINMDRQSIREIESIKVQQTLSVVEFILKSLSNLMVLFKRLKSKNEKGFTYVKLKANVIKLLNIFTSSKLISFNEFSDQDNERISITEIYKKLQQKVLQLSDVTENKEEAIEVGLNLYKEWQQKLKSQNYFKNDIILLITLQNFNKINISQKLKVKSFILADQLFKQHNLSNIIEQCIAFHGTNGQNDGSTQQIIHLTLLVIEFILIQSQLNTKQEKQQRWISNLQNMILEHCSFFVQICLKEISSYSSQEPHIKANCPRYLNLIVQIFNLSHLRQSKFDHSAKMKNGQSVKNKLFGQLYAKNRINENEAKKMIANLVWTAYSPTIVDNNITKMKVSLAEIAIKFDQYVLNEIINKNYLINLSSLLINQIQANLIIKHQKHQQQQQSIIFVSQCMTIFYEFFRRQLGFFISPDISSTFLKAINHVISANSPVVSSSQIVKWLSMTMRQVKAGIKNNGEFVTILEKSIFYIANRMIHQNWSRQTGKYLVQICALYITNQKSVAKKLRKKQYIVTLCLPFLKVCTAAVQILTNDPSILLSNPNDEILIKVGAAVILKASQFINIYYLCQKQLPSQEVYIQTNQTVVLMKKILQSIVPNIRKQNQVQIKDTLDLICQMLSLGKQQIKVDYINYNEALITIAMREDQSSRQCFVGLITQVLNWRKRDSNKKNFRSHYLLYFLMKQIIGSDKSKLAFFQYSNLSALQLQQKSAITLHPKVKQSMMELVYHLLQKSQQKNLVRITWNIILLSHILIMHPCIISTGIFANKIQQLCIQNLELVNQNTGRQNSMIFWVIFMHTLSISILILTTNKQKNPNFNCVFMQSIRKGIVKRLDDCICIWDQLRCNEEKKIFHIGIQSIDALENDVDNHSLRENFHKNVLVKPNQQVSSSQEKENSFVGYLNCNMVLAMIFGGLHFYSIDKRKTNLSSQKIFKSRLIEFSRLVLSNYFSFHETYFKVGIKQTSAVRSEQNLDFINTMSKAYTTQINLNMRQNYLNKVVADFVGFNKVLNIHSLHITLPELEKNQLPSLIWYNLIEETLTHMGVKVSYKLPLAQLSLKSQSSLRNSRRSSASRRK